MNTIPESLRYILWRYSLDHQGEDHQARHADAVAWLEQRPAWEPVSHLVSLDGEINANENSLSIGMDDTGKVTFLWPDDGYDYALMRRMQSTREPTP